MEKDITKDNPKEQSENIEKDKDKEVTPFTEDLNPHEAYSKLNQSYLKNLKEAEQKIESYFSNFEKNKKFLIEDAKEYVKERYKDTIENIESGLKILEETAQTVDKSNQLEVKRLKRKMDDLINLLEKESDMDNQFTEIFDKMDRKLKFLRIQDMLAQDFKIGFRGKFGRLGWNDTEDPILEVRPGGSSYKCYWSSESFENELTCKVRILSITDNLVSGYWNYGFGVIKDGTENTNQSSYYNNAAILQSNGHCNQKFTGSSDTVNRKTEPWKTGDVIAVFRDTDGHIFFSVNDSERVQCFEGVTGKMRVVIGTSSSISGNQFEMIEIGSYF